MATSDDPPADAPPLRYAVLRHEGVPDPHFDLMFETSTGSPLATWRAASWPLRTGTPLTPLPDHRRAYLTYEGPLSNDRGFVRRVETGGHRVREDHPAMLVVQLESDGSVLRLFRGPPGVAQVLPGEQR
jgi:hypothetical protein